jgi:hypothetical protein
MTRRERKRDFRGGSISEFFNTIGRYGPLAAPSWNDRYLREADELAPTLSVPRASWRGAADGETGHARAIRAERLVSVMGGATYR